MPAEQSRAIWARHIATAAYLGVTAYMLHRWERRDA
jgi:hypothetical protein